MCCNGGKIGDEVLNCKKKLRPGGASGKGFLWNFLLQGNYDFHSHQVTPGDCKPALHINLFNED